LGAADHRHRAPLLRLHGRRRKLLRGGARLKSRPARDARIAVFVKAPVPGKVKTRLCPPLSAEQAAALYAAFVADTLDVVRGVAGARAAVCYDGAEGFADLRWLPDDPGLPLFAQRGADLGARLKACFAELFSAGAGKAVAIGSDTPHLGADALRAALALLDRRDLVLGPATDGGYYLIGLNAPADFLFEGIPWSTPRVFAETVRRAERRGLRVGLLPELFDVDTAADLRALEAAEPASRAPASRRVLRTLRARGGVPGRCERR
jgi:rSAM/selenodomain-associated transferase 1